MCLLTAYLFDQRSLTATIMTACWCGVLFFASAVASSAYLTVSEVFPMETRAGHRVLLCHRDRCGRDHRAVAVFVPGQHG